MNDNEILKLAIESGIIDVTLLRTKVELMRKNEILTSHNHSVWQGNKDYWYTYLNVNGKRKLVKRKEKKDLEEEIVKYYDTECYNPTFHSVFMQWADEKLANGEIQKQSYDRYLADYTRFFTEFGVKRIANITEDELYTFIKTTIHDFKLTAKAYSGMRTLILGTFKYAKRKKYTDLSISTFFEDIDLSRGIYKKKRVKDKESVFTDEEVKLIYDEIEREPISLLNLGVRLALETGLRGGELCALQYKDLHKNVLDVSKTEIRYKKDNQYIYEIRDSTKGKYDARKVVLLPQTVELIEQIHRINPNGEYLFEKDGKRIIAKCFTGKLRRLCKKVGILPRSLHKLRKTYVTKLANGGVPQKVICAQVGHTDFTTTTNYYWFNNQSTEQVQQLIGKALR